MFNFWNSASAGNNDQSDVEIVRVPKSSSNADALSEKPDNEEPRIVWTPEEAKRTFKTFNENLRKWDETVDETKKALEYFTQVANTVSEKLDQVSTKLTKRNSSIKEVVKTVVTDVLDDKLAAFQLEMKEDQREARDDLERELESEFASLHTDIGTLSKLIIGMRDSLQELREMTIQRQGVVTAPQARKIQVSKPARKEGEEKHTPSGQSSVLPPIVPPSAPKVAVHEMESSRLATYAETLKRASDNIAATKGQINKLITQLTSNSVKLSSTNTAVAATLKRLDETNTAIANLIERMKSEYLEDDDEFDASETGTIVGTDESVSAALNEIDNHLEVLNGLHSDIKTMQQSLRTLSETMSTRAQAMKSFIQQHAESVKTAFEESLREMLAPLSEQLGRIELALRNRPGKEREREREREEEIRRVDEPSYGGIHGVAPSTHIYPLTHVAGPALVEQPLRSYTQGPFSQASQSRERELPPWQREHQHQQEPAFFLEERFQIL